MTTASARRTSMEGAPASSASSPTKPHSPFDGSSGEELVEGGLTLRLEPHLHKHPVAHVGDDRLAGPQRPAVACHRLDDERDGMLVATKVVVDGELGGAV